jgi:glyoxylase-like metal-dependent hydrolase (beta-lactamase superfamily II)
MGIAGSFVTKLAKGFARAIIGLMPTAIENTGVQGVLRLNVGGDVAYLLFRGKEAVLGGAGGHKHLPLVELALKEQDLSWSNLRAILLPNADPGSFAGVPAILNNGKVPVYIHRLEEPRLAMRPTENLRWNPRRWSEARKRRKGNCQPCTPDLYITDGDLLDLWCGLKVVSLPGYSSGNCGFYCRHLNILFAGSLPLRPNFFRRAYEKLYFDTETLANSRAKALALKPSAILVS